MATHLPPVVRLVPGEHGTEARLGAAGTQGHGALRQPSATGSPSYSCCPICWGSPHQEGKESPLLPGATRRPHQDSLCPRATAALTAPREGPLGTVDTFEAKIVLPCRQRHRKTDGQAAGPPVGVAPHTRPLHRGLNNAHRTGPQRSQRPPVPRPGQASVGEAALRGPGGCDPGLSGGSPGGTWEDSSDGARVGAEWQQKPGQSQAGQACAGPERAGGQEVSEGPGERGCGWHPRWP